MKLAIMQPYFFPYIGYFQLIKSTDKFIFLDDAAFIKKGWINKNRFIVNNNQDYFFSVPLSKPSQNKNLTEIEVSQTEFDHWKIKFFKTLQQRYNNAPYYDEVINLVRAVFKDKGNTIGSLAATSVIQTCEFLDIPHNFSFSSSKHGRNNDLKGQTRILEICKEEGAKCYVNMIGGKSLYDYPYFEKDNVQLSFLNPKFISYNQDRHEFVGGLSILDVLMYNSVEKIKTMLENYTLISNVN
ncbi:WbqC family protein [Gangjinia marincola]|uniref:WbqC family protein n=1 Tax=Gangjinia marincola TaxID=578463 RepID=A0ABP3XTE3_9FLAO